jgi:hypothetical protein
MTPALKLAKLQEARRASGQPETLTDLIHRVRFAAEWNQEKAEKDAEQARGFGRLAAEYTAQQREDAVYTAASFYGEANVRRDAARILDSIADALVALVGDVAPL